MLKRGIAITANIRHLVAAHDGVVSREIGIEGIILASGRSGLGKTTAMTHLAISSSPPAIYLCCLPVWSLHGMLQDLCRHCGATPGRRNEDMLRSIIRRVLETQQTLLFDEVDLLFYLDSKVYNKILETIRMIYNETQRPIVLVGEENVGLKIKPYERLWGRISQHVKFQPMTLADARTTANTLSNARYNDDILTALLKRSNGSMRLFIGAFGKLDAIAGRLGDKEIGMEAYDDTKLFTDL